MIRDATLMSVLVVLIAGPAQADCLVDYKAKKDDPLQLHYGVIRLDDADCADPAPAISDRIAGDGWTLLTVMDDLSEAEAEERRSDAGAYFLRY
ncbi:hypothetical protein [Palleronia abyssalis]|uniref:DUF4177 domain-containing protein n=1 Tax=Palleronia abyssalis TaxID=1501240 RepID=A0A2R8BT38_9RHOB|nr:hypothetical protein [Palleronia abyssalis]SPJ23288.1 hypothetical protein PAA8504_01098 [Palleronia abyssalis]